MKSGRKLAVMLRTTTCQYQKDLIVVVKMSLNDSQSPKRKPLEKNLSKWVETWWGKTSRRVEASDKKFRSPGSMLNISGS